MRSYLSAYVFVDASTHFDQAKKDPSPKCVHEFVQKLLCDDDWSWVRLCNRITVLARTTCLQNPDKLTLGYWTLKKKMTDSVNDWSIFGFISDQQSIRSLTELC